MGIDNKLGLGRSLGFKVGTIATAGLIGIMSYLGVGCKVQPITQQEIIETKSAVVETYQETTPTTGEMVVETVETPTVVIETKPEVKDPLQEKLELVASQYSSGLANKLETIQDKTYLEGIMNDNEVLSSMNFFFETNQIDKMLELKPNFKSWNDLYKKLSGRSDEVINQYINESVEYSGKIGALIITCGYLTSSDYDTVLFKYFFNNKNNIPTTIIQNKSDEQLMKNMKIFYSQFSSYPLIKEVVDEISIPNEFVKRDKSKKEILEEIASQISNPETKLDIIAITTDYNETEGSFIVSSPHNNIYPKELSDVISNNYIEGKKIILINNFCFPLQYTEDMNKYLDEGIDISVINPTGKRVVSLDDLPESFFALADRGVTLADLKYFGDDSTVNFEHKTTYEGRTFNRRMSIFDINNFELWIDNNDFMNFEPNIISNEEISQDKIFVPYNIK